MGRGHFKQWIFRVFQTNAAVGGLAILISFGIINNSIRLLDYIELVKHNFSIGHSSAAALT